MTRVSASIERVGSREKPTIPHIGRSPSFYIYGLAYDICTLVAAFEVSSHQHFGYHAKEKAKQRGNDQQCHEQGQRRLNERNVLNNTEPNRPATNQERSYQCIYSRI